MSNNPYNNSGSPAADLELGFRNYIPLAFRANFRDDNLDGLPLPDFLASLVITESRIELPKSNMKDLKIPQNTKVFTKISPTKGKTDSFMLPNEVNDLLTAYAQRYLSYQFTIKFIQYIENPVNRVKPIVSDNEELMKTLAYFKDNRANIDSLQSRFQEAENNCSTNVATVQTKIAFKPDIVGFKTANELVLRTKRNADGFLNKFFQKGKFEILRQSGFKEASILDNMKTSNAGYNLIRKHEKFVPKLYSNDGGGRGGNCTIGYGHLIHRGVCTSADFAKYPNGISQAESEAFLKKDVEGVENIIRRNVTVQLTQNQFDALVSFLFTSGRFFPDLLTKLNAGDFEGVPAEMKRIIYSNGKIAPGLVTRREEETRLFSSK